MSLDLHGKIGSVIDFCYQFLSLQLFTAFIFSHQQTVSCNNATPPTSTHPSFFELCLFTCSSFAQRQFLQRKLGNERLLLKQIQISQQKNYTRPGSALGFVNQISLKDVSN